MSNVPKCLTVIATRFWMSACFVTSHLTANALGPSARATVFGPYCRQETVLGTVRKRDGVCLILKRKRRKDGAKYFLARKLVIARYRTKERGPHVVAALRQPRRKLAFCQHRYSCAPGPLD